MTRQALARARAGDEEAFRALTDPYRRELQVHIYRIVGSMQDAEDLLQETLLAAWRGLEQFEGRASLRAWLYRIATNRSLDALRASRRRPEDLQRMTEMPEPTRRASRSGSSPTPTSCSRASPTRLPDRRRATRPGRRSRWRSSSACSISRRSSARCSCCATCSASAPGRSPRCSTPARRRSTACCAARVQRSSRACPATGRERAPLPNSRLERDIVGRFADAFEAGDIDGVVALLTDDAWLTMPPEPYEYQGRGRDRRVPARPRGPPRRAATARADARQRPARVRLLPPGRPDRDRAAVRRCSSSRSRATGYPRSPGSPAAACSRTSDCRGCSDRNG